MASDSGVLKRANVQTNPAVYRTPCGTSCTFVQRNPIYERSLPDRYELDELGVDKALGKSGGVKVPSASLT